MKSTSVYCAAYTGDLQVTAAAEQVSRIRACARINSNLPTRVDRYNEQSRRKSSLNTNTASAGGAVIMDNLWPASAGCQH